eukprot:SAG31_NODE_736_length_12477_cov_60.959363_11_plen_68_part_00
MHSTFWWLLVLLLIEWLSIFEAWLAHRTGESKVMLRNREDDEARQQQMQTAQRKAALRNNREAAAAC